MTATRPLAAVAVAPEPGRVVVAEGQEEAAVQEAAVQEAAVQEVVVQEAAVQEAVVLEVVVQEAVVQEAVVQEVAVQEAAVQEAAVQEAAVQEAVVQEVAVMAEQAPVGQVDQVDQVVTRGLAQVPLQAVLARVREDLREPALAPASAAVGRRLPPLAQPRARRASVLRPAPRPSTQAWAAAGLRA